MPLFFVFLMLYFYLSIVIKIGCNRNSLRKRFYLYAKNCFHTQNAYYAMRRKQINLEKGLENLNGDFKINMKNLDHKLEDLDINLDLIDLLNPGK